MDVRQNLWLIGNIRPIENTKRLPKAIEVLKAFSYHQIVDGQTADNSANKLAENLIKIWQKCKLPTLLPRNIVIKIKNVKKAYDALKKSRFRRSARQAANEKLFMKENQRLFNIKSQKVNDISSMDLQVQDQDGNEDVQTTQNVNLDNQLVTAKRIRKSIINDIDCSEICLLEEDPIHVEPDGDCDPDFEKTVSGHYKTQIQGKRSGFLKKILNSPDVTSAVDRVNLSSPKFTMIAAAMARACEEDINKITISSSTVSRKRSHHRQSIVDDIRREFKLSIESISGLTVHWDGKIMKNYNDAEDSSDDEDEEKVDRIAVVVTG